MRLSFQLSLAAVLAIVVAGLLNGGALAADTNNENGLPEASVSEDGQFDFVPLTDVAKPSTPRVAGAHPQVVLALGGGGMRGAAHVGVLKALVEAGIPISGIAGTSMGSIVGGLYSAGVPLSQIEKDFVNGSLMKSFVPVPIVIRVMAAPILSAPRLIGFHPYDGLYFGAPFHKYLNKALPEGKKKIESLTIPYSAVAIDLCDGHVYSIRKGSLISAMQASSAVPALRKPIEIGGKLFVDGGVLANVPVPQARQLGGDLVVAVQIDEHFKKEEPASFRKIGSVTRRMVKLQLAALDSYHERAADIVIHPNVDGITLISTKKSDARNAIAAGEEAAKKAIPLIKQKLENIRLAGSASQQ